MPKWFYSRRHVYFMIKWNWRNHTWCKSSC